jgi:hypothetical protein
MKLTFIPVLITVTILFTACSNDRKTVPGTHNSGETPVNDDSKVVTPAFAQIDPKVAASFKEMVNHYLQLKNALAADNASEAASGAKALKAALSKIDPATMTPGQKKLYQDNADDVKENADHIARRPDNIKHQREHFAMLSEDMYDLVKGFGGGQLLYQDHCPMARDNKGANWLSETREINNPYLGKEMPECGSVEAVIR